MKKLLFALSVVTMLTVPVVVIAATCQDSHGTVSGDVCGHIAGECVCYDKPKT